MGGERTAASQTRFTDSESDVRHSEGVRGGPLQGDFWSRIRLWKAVAEGITGSRCQPAEDPFRAIFGLELDCRKLWRRE